MSLEDRYTLAKQYVDAGNYMKAVATLGSMIRFVPNQTLEICLIAVKNCPCALEHVKQQTVEICMESVKSNWVSFFSVKDKTPEIALVAIKHIIKYLRTSGVRDVATLRHVRNILHFTTHVSQDIVNEIGDSKIFSIMPQKDMYFGKTFKFSGVQYCIIYKV